MRKIFLLMIVVCITAACATVPRENAFVMPPITPRQTYIEPEQSYANPGSIYSPDGADALFADTRARRVGDIVMVKIIENHSADNKADLTTSKDSMNEYSVNAGLSAAAGVLPKNGIALSTNSASGTTGAGETSRENSVSATIAARVLRVLPNGILQIEGVRETQVNNEIQYLVITGLVRAIDVAPDNSIMSNRIADAHIAYYGKGVISDKQKPGWFSRFMDNAWPF